MRRKNILKGLAVVISIVLLAMIIIPAYFKDEIVQKVKTYANSSIEASLDFSDVGLSFFRHFPFLSVSLYDVKMKGSVPFADSPLIHAKEVSLGIDLLSLWKKELLIQQVYLDDADIWVKVNTKGETNYNIYVSEASTVADTVGLDIKIAGIFLKNINLSYEDATVPISIVAKQLNYTGKGDLNADIFDLHSKVAIQALDLSFDGTKYLNKKKVEAKLKTKVNTKSLSFEFERNDLKINQLPVQFKGLFSIIENGYDVDFSLQTRKAQLDHLLSLVPPEMIPWLENTKASGEVNIIAFLKGRHNAVLGTQPDMGLKASISGGKIQHRDAKQPITDGKLKLDVHIPALDIDRVSVVLDTLSFQLKEDYFRTNAEIKGLNPMSVKANLNTDLDLDLVDKALGIAEIDLKGRFKATLNANGNYTTESVQKKRFGEPETVISSIPNFDLAAVIKDGYFKMAELPEALKDIQLDLHVGTKSNQIDGIFVDIPQIKASALGNKVLGKIKVGNLKTLPVDVDLKTNINLAEISSFLPLEEGFKLAGALDLDIKSKGKYVPEQHLFPLTNARILLKNGEVLTPYYPKPISDIQVILNVIAPSMNINELRVDLEPISFRFEEQPFMLKADLSNPNNLKYNIISKGEIDLAKIAQVFSPEGVELSGLVKTDLNLQGLQSDAMAGRYHLLNNQGNLELSDIRLLWQEYLPLPVELKSGKFSFHQDKINMDQFLANYGKSDLSMTGKISNVIEYLLDEKAVLKGDFNINSTLLVLDELTTPSDSTNSTDSSASGIILLPKNLDVQLKTDIKETLFQGLSLKNLQGTAKLKSGELTLEKTSVQVADATANLDLEYKPVSISRAPFDIKLDIKNFDVQKMYKEVELFRTMVSSAEYVSGNVGLDYQLSGVLNEKMEPIYPSLKGGGEIKVQDAKLKGFKLMNELSKSSGRDSLSNPNVKDVVIKTKIENNIITLERTKLKILGFRPRFEGQVSFDGDLNLKGRLGLPPFGIVGIPFTVTGNQDNPKVKIRRGKNAEGLDEVEFDEDLEDAPAETIPAEEGK